MRSTAVLAALTLVAAACATSAGAVSTTTGTTTVSSTAAPAATTVPDVDLSRHSVPLDEVLFDTFDGGSVPLSEATPDLIVSLRDAIVPIDEPTYGGPEAGGWLADTDVVLGYVAGDAAYAYPVKILDVHEVVNDDLGGLPVLISYCPLCRSGVVFDRRVDGLVLDFGNTSALHESDLVMLDRQTGSYWWQVAGEAIVGTLTGTRLIVLPSGLMTWQAWLALHPDTLVLEPPSGSVDVYDRDRLGGYEQFLDSGQFAFPVKRLDNRLPASELVIGIEVGDVARVYPIEDVARSVVNDTIATTSVAVFIDGSGGAAAYAPEVEGRRLSFRVTDGVIRDEQTGSLWSGSGLAIDGELAGARLTALPSRTAFWFAYVGAFPDTEVWAS